jgi:transcriptional regulator with XRE-family HTH domain
LRRYPVLDRAITEQIARARQAAGMSQRELSSKLGRRNNYIQNIESGGQSVTASELHVIGCECDTTGPELLSRAIRAAKGRWLNR